ncbi:hypothetical protein ACHAPX_001129 [Trichoderma viride]
MPGTTNGNTAQDRPRKRKRQGPIAQSQSPIAQSQSPIAQSQSPSQTRGPIVAQSRGPSHLSGVNSRRTTFFVNREHASKHSVGGTYSGQMHVELHQPVQAVPLDVQKNIVLLHGDFFTGQTWLEKVDGSQSWAAYFLKKGYNVFVVDLPGVGKSSFLNENDYQVPGVPRTVRKLTGELVEQEFTASEKRPLPDGSLAWVSADRHSQWPGSGLRGDEYFDKLMASTTGMVLPKLQHEELGAIAMTDLLKKIGPSFLLGHGTGATIGMLAADAVPRLVRGLISIEPDGPPCASAGRILQGRMTYTPYLQYDPNIRRYGVSDAPLTFSPPLQPAPGVHPLKTQVRQMSNNNGCYIVQQKQPNIIIHRRREEQETVPQLLQLLQVPHAIYTSESSPHSVYDWSTTRFLRHAGSLVDYFPLPDNRVQGNGHLMHLEKNSDAIAGLMDEWLAKRIEDDDKARKGSAAAHQKDVLQYGRVTEVKGPKDDPFELEFVVQPDAVAHQASLALAPTPPNSIASVDPAGPVASVDPAGLVASVDHYEREFFFQPDAIAHQASLALAPTPPDSIASVDPAGPVATVDPRQPELVFQPDAIADQASPALALSPLAFNEPELDFQPDGFVHLYSPALAPSPPASSELEIFPPNIVARQASLALSSSPPAVRGGYLEFGTFDPLDLPSAKFHENEDLFNNEWTEFFNGNFA